MNVQVGQEGSTAESNNFDTNNKDKSCSEISLDDILEALGTSLSEFFKDESDDRVVFRSNDFYKYIKQHTIFSPLMISKEFDINIYDVYKIIDILIINNIIIYKKIKKEVVAYE